jgi:4-diphosphocytidyl-2-C-methyl-D-erythritol kinase
MLIRELAPAKINLALHVLGRRADGYHELDSIVAFASVGDVLELEQAPKTSLIVDGPFAAEVPLTANNLVLRAYAAVAQNLAVPAVAMRLTKNLPVASGIGGGSADAAAALRGLARLVGRSLEAETLHRIALSLGADVPVCLHGKACRMQGVGEIITSVDHVPAKAIVLVNPLQPCGTAEVFRAMGLKPGDRLGTALEVLTPAEWRNDMTAAAVEVLPDIADVLTLLNTIAPGKTVRMSGSGATCFALCDDFDQADLMAQQVSALQPDWWVAPAYLT